MAEDTQEAIKNAQALGVFQGTVLQALADIKQKLDDINSSQYSQDVKIALKADQVTVETIRKDVEDIKKKVYIFIGASSAISSMTTTFIYIMTKKFF